MPCSKLLALIDTARRLNSDSLQCCWVAGNKLKSIFSAEPPPPEALLCQVNKPKRQEQRGKEGGRDFDLKEAKEESHHQAYKKPAGDCQRSQFRNSNIARDLHLTEVAQFTHALFGLEQFLSRAAYFEPQG
jgi:hypothetical protein